MKTDELRQAYLEFFVSKGCVLRPSDVLVPNDPTVLFTPAGMNQFKREFMGLGDPNFTRATTCQKCIRTGDIDNVGRTPRHMTFFEMLGNFSFGDYFKREAIHWAWELLTKVFAIPADRLTITVYLDDDEAYKIWHDEVKVPANRITRMGEDDNFWPAGAPTHGPNGVCGPCSEIFYHGDGIDEVEIWNLVFTQFNRIGPGELEPLPKKNIDTGMGLERMAAAMQGVPSNFEIDIFKPIVASVAEHLGVKYDREEPDGVRIRRMADHVRALTFTIHENVRPSAEKQGYVIRRLLRRAVLDAYQMGQRDPFLFEVVPTVVQAMEKGYPDLKESTKRIQTVIREEEEQFLKNLENGLRLLEDTFRKTKAGGNQAVSGKDAFLLHATYGIPVEVTESLATDHGLRVDTDAFNAERKRHGELSRGTTEAAAVFATGPLDTLKQDYHQGTEFLAYTANEADAKIIGIIAQNKLADSTEAADASTVALVLDRSPFYGESGGQVGDVGAIKGTLFLFEVTDTKKENDFILHIGRVVEGKATVGERVHAAVDSSRRDAIRRAHTATHVLHHALQGQLGKHAQQAGSKVEPDRLRFDFANPESIPRDRLRSIEEEVNLKVLHGDPVSWSLMPIEEARGLGAMALFGEKYPDIVRVVKMGEFSKELCGGTHLENVGQVGLFKIIGEESVSSGTRRITALTGKGALDYVRAEEETLAQVSAALRVAPSQAADRVATLLEEVKTLKKQLAQRKEQGGATGTKLSADEIIASAKDVDGIKVIAQTIDNASPDELRQLIDVLRRKLPERMAVLLASAVEGKVHLASAVTADLIEQGYHAGKWLKEIAPKVGGGGGGRPDMAQAGGKDPAKIPDALEHAIKTIASIFGGK